MNPTTNPEPTTIEQTGPHPTGPNIESFEPSHGPNIADRSDLIDPRSVPPEHIPTSPRQPDTGDAGQEAEKAGGRV
jgi:hypothetical protein